MDVQTEISIIERRLKGAGHSVAKLLRRAEVDASQWVRWKQGGQVPLLSTWSKIISAADDLAPLEEPTDATPLGRPGFGAEAGR